MLEVDTIPENETKQLPDFVPVIFANGKDDDSYGIAAWIRQDQRVQFDGRIYKPGEVIVIDGRQMRFERGIKIEAPFGELLLWLGGTGNPLRILCSPNWRNDEVKTTLRIKRCSIDMAGGTFLMHPEFMGFKGPKPGGAI